MFCPSFDNARCAAATRLISAAAGALVEAVVVGACETPERRNCAIGSKSGCLTAGLGCSATRAEGAGTIDTGADRGAEGGIGGAGSVTCAGGAVAMMRGAGSVRCAAGCGAGCGARATCSAGFTSCFANNGAGWGPSCMKSRLDMKLTTMALHASMTSVRRGRRIMARRNRASAGASAPERPSRICGTRLTLGSTRAVRGRARRLGCTSSR